MQEANPANGIDIEQVQVVLTLKNSSQRPADAYSTRPAQNHGQYIINIPEEERMTKLYHSARTGDQNGANKIFGEGQEKAAVLNSRVLSSTNETVLKQVEFVEMFLKEPCIDQLINERPMPDEDKVCLFFSCVNNDLFDLALTLLKDSPRLELDCKRDDNSETALHVLARKTSAFSSQHQGIVGKLVSGCRHFTCARSLKTQASEFLIELLKQLKRRPTNVFQDVIRRPRHLLFEAAALGNFSFLDSIIRTCPALAWEANREGKFIFHTAILNRHMDIFKLIDRTELLKVLRAWEDESAGDNILHFAAKLPPKDILINSAAGEALQMQKEVLLFKELEKLVPAPDRNKRNSEGKTPKQVFTLEHEDLMKRGEKCMKENASYCLLVATLIVTVVFPAAFTNPDNNNHNNDSESSKHHPKEELIILSMTNAIAMATSTMSIMMFFCLLISRYAEHDFMWSLPWRFKVGLVSLIVSLVTMTVSFCIATFVTYAHHGTTWSHIIIVSALTIAGISVIWFLIRPLLREI